MTTGTGTEFVVVTGCTQGLGYHAVRELSRTLTGDSRVVLACRDVAAARAAAARISDDTRSEPARLLVLDAPLDLADLDSVRAYAAALRAHLEGAGAPHGA